MGDYKTMKCYVRRRQCKEDRLSSLPDVLLIDILSRVPIYSAVTTSVLSHRWRHLWTGLNCIKLGHPAIIDHILCQLTSPKLCEFHLDLDGLNRSEFPKFSATRSWFRHICSRNVETVTVNSGSEFLFRIPPRLFSSPSLVTLKLWGLFRLKFPKNRGICFRLPNLKILTLESLDEVPIWLETLITSCPLLEALNLGIVPLSYPQPCTAVNIIAPNLKSLSIRKVPFFNLLNTRISIDAPRLANLDICDHTSIYYFLHNPTTIVTAHIDLKIYCCGVEDEENEDTDYLQGMSKFVAGLSSVTNLKLMVENPSNIFPYFNPANLPMFSNLVYLELESICFKDLMLSLPLFPSLEHLLVYICSKDDDLPMEERNWQVWDSIPDCLVSKLKTMQINRLKGTGDDLSMLAYILKSAVVLKRLYIEVRMKDGIYVKDEREKGYAIWRECQLFGSLFKLPRSSSTCELFVSGRYLNASGNALQDSYLTSRIYLG